MPEVHIRKELYEKLEGHGVNATERVNAILRNYVSSIENAPDGFGADETHLRAYSEHGNAD